MRGCVTRLASAKATAKRVTPPYHGSTFHLPMSLARKLINWLPLPAVMRIFIHDCTKGYISYLISRQCTGRLPYLPYHYMRYMAYVWRYIYIFTQYLLIIDTYHATCHFCIYHHHRYLRWWYLSLYMPLATIIIYFIIFMLIIIVWILLKHILRWFRFLWERKVASPPPTHIT